MLATKLYAPTLREVPSDADVVSQQLMLRAGFMRKTANGLYSFLPLGWRSIKKIEAIVREEMDRASAQEIMMPILQPAEIWKESGRWKAYGAEMMRINDRHDNEFCLGPTHEEMITTLVKNEINSYRQLPVNLYQIQSKFRDERRPRYGLMRSREFIMKDAYSFDVDEAGLEESYKSMYDAYTRIFNRCGLTFRPVEADSGAIGGSGTHEFMAIAEAGEADIVYCTKCDYAANIEIGKPGIIKQDEEALQELSVVDTPNASTIEAVAEMLNLPLHKTIKAVVFSIDGKVVLAIVRGDHEVNEVAVQHAVLGSVEPEMATSEELEKVGLTAGFISPVGLQQTDEFAIVVDESVMETYNAAVSYTHLDVYKRQGNDGAQIRLSIPQLTEERRKEIVKVVHKKAEDAKVAVRNIRRDVNEALKKEEKAKTITEDDAKDGLDQIQKLTDAKVKQIDELKAVKEKDVLEV